MNNRTTICHVGNESYNGVIDIQLLSGTCRLFEGFSVHDWYNKSCYTSNPYKICPNRSYAIWFI